jgi:hypothetical protein
MALRIEAELVLKPSSSKPMSSPSPTPEPGDAIDRAAEALRDPLSRMGVGFDGFGPAELRMLARAALAAAAECSVHSWAGDVSRDHARLMRERDRLRARTHEVPDSGDYERGFRDGVVAERDGGVVQQLWEERRQAIRERDRLASELLALREER